MNKTKTLILLLITAFTLNAADKGLIGDVETLKSNAEMHIIEYYKGKDILKGKERALNLNYTSPKFKIGSWVTTNNYFSPKKAGVYRFSISAMNQSCDSTSYSNDDVKLFLVENDNKKIAKLWIGAIKRGTCRTSASSINYLELKSSDKLKIQVESESEDAHLKDIKISLEYLGEEN